MVGDIAIGERFMSTSNGNDMTYSKRFFAAALLLGLSLSAFGASSPLQKITGTITTENLVDAGACTTGGCVEVDVATAGALTIQVTGTYTATGGLSAQITTDGSTWVTLGATSTFTRQSTGVATATITSGQQDIYQVSAITGARRFRVTALGAVTGTATITIQRIELSIGSSGGGGTDGVAQGSTTSGQSGPLVQCAVTTGAPTYTTAQTSPISCDTSGNVRVVGGAGGTSSSFGAAVPATGTAAGLSDGTNMVLPRAFDADSGAGTQTVAGVSLRKAASGGSVEAGTSTDPLRTDPTGTTTQPVSGTVTANVGTGTQAISAASASIASGAMVDLGAQADAAAAADTSTASLIALTKRNNQNLTTLNTSVNADPTTAAPVAPATAIATKSSLQGCQFASAGVTFTDGQQGRVSCSANGRVLVDTAFASSAAVTLTRTADTVAYAANDVMGAATGSTAALTFASMCPISGGNIMLTSVTFEIDQTTAISGETSHRLYLYNVTPPSALGDNVAFDLPSGDRASFLGYVDLGTAIDLGSTFYVQTTAVNKQLKCSGTSLFGYLVTNGAFTPTSARVHVVTLNAIGL